MQTETIWETLWRVMSARNLYAILVGMALIYFTFNHSLIGMSRDMVMGYSFLYILSLMFIFMSGEKLITKSKGLFNWEGKKENTILSMSAAWTVGLFGTLAIVGLIYGLQQRDDAALPQEAIFSNLAQQTLIVTPVETIVFCVIIPQYLHFMFGPGKWQLILIYIVSQTAFAMMHYTAYAGDAANVLLAFFAGCIFLFVTIKIRPEMAQGIHLGLNILALGIIGV